MATILNAPVAVRVISGEPRWEGPVPTWTNLPGASIPLNFDALGIASAQVFVVATFSAEALPSGPDGGVVSATVFFGDAAGEPSSNNHRYVTTRGNPEWSSHTFIRTKRLPRSAGNIVAQVKLGGSANMQAGIQNWVLKVEVYNV
ncbi:hypothetical protein BDZ94DRAFT_1312423 [Collybia nuda]|uniref:Uncharacterized protein n=1 Tax=Collybia nuda TaxID=64659 RepID=A0A9P5XZE1_9AGAR|nr:hypothetical protein BDZ94DRAFT_1312423 [Collybia nuda]